MLKGFVIICNKEFEVEELVFNSFSNLAWKGECQALEELFDFEEKESVANMKQTLTSEGAIIDCEINTKFDDGIKPLKLSGGKIEDRYFILAFETNNDVPLLYEELMRINNEQSNYIRKIVKERFMPEQKDEADNQTFEELSRLNNELANLQRELSKKNVELRKLNDLKNHFLGMAAHDLRNPLGHIYNYAELIEVENGNFSAKQIKFLDKIKSLSKFMATLVNELLDYSVIESGKMQLNLVECNVEELIVGSIEQNQRLADRKQIRLDFFSTNEGVQAKIDVGKINQVLTNLLTNAIKYSQPKSAVIILIYDQEKNVEISIKDEGQGIAEEEIKNLFKPFYKAASKTTGGEHSTGLGLFISKQIVEAHCGKIWVKSKMGEGSEFCFSIPKNNPIPCL